MLCPKLCIVLKTLILYLSFIHVDCCNNDRTQDFLMRDIPVLCTENKTSVECFNINVPRGDPNEVWNYPENSSVTCCLELGRSSPCFGGIGNFISLY